MIVQAASRHLRITKTPNPTTYTKVGDTIAYTYVLTNTGNVTLTGPFSVTDDKTTVTCPPSPASLDPGDSITCSATYAIVQADIDAGSVTNTATGHAANGNKPVDSGRVSATVNGQALAPHLAITKVPNPTTYTATGDVIDYTIVLTNDGNVTLNDPTVSDPLVSALDCGTVPASLAPGEKVTCTATHTITDADMTAGYWNNTATGTAHSGNTTITVEAEATVTGPVRTPHISITKTANPTTYTQVGNVISYTIVLTNDGNVVLTNPTVTDPKVSSLDCGTLPASLAPGKKITCTASHTITQADVDAGSFKNTATGHAHDGATTLTDTASATVTLVAKSPHLSIVKTAAPSTYSKVGDVIAFTIVLTNDGNVTLTNPTVSDPTVTDLDCGTLPASLAPGAKITCTASHTITAADIDAGSVTNTATGHAHDGDSPVDTDPSSVTVHAVQGPELQLVKTADKTTFTRAGEKIVYTYVLTNTGNVTISSPFTVTDNKTTVTCPDDPTTLAPHDKITCTSTYTVTAADIAAHSVTNLATGHAVYNDKPVDSKQVSLTVGANATPTPTKTPKPSQSVGGVSFTPPPTNTGSGKGPIDGPTPLFALLICLAFGSLTLLAVQVQRRSIHR